MHSMLRYLVNCIADGKPVDWESVDKELERITISEREKKLCKELKTIYGVNQTFKEIKDDEERTS